VKLAFLALALAACVPTTAGPVVEVNTFHAVQLGAGPVY
jgi:hypothetical protein